MAILIQLKEDVAILICYSTNLTYAEINEINDYINFNIFIICEI